MIVLFLFFLAYFHIYDCKGELIFKSCQHALLSLKKGGKYQIRPKIDGKVSVVDCNFLNSTHGTVTLGNNLEDIKELGGLSQHELNFYVDKVKYENFDDSDIDEFLKYAGECSQTMVYENTGVAPLFQKTLFWDGTLLESINLSPDNICKCFLTKTCIDNNNPASLCYSDGANDNSWKRDSGEFSVNSSRLPLKEIRTGDIGNSHERVRYSIGKLKCTFSIRNFDIIDTSKNNCPKNLKILTDGNPMSCFTPKVIDINYKLESNFSITAIKLQTNIQGKCNLHIFPFVKRNKVNTLCKYEKNCLFSCPESKDILVHILSHDVLKINVCEISLTFVD